MSLGGCTETDQTTIEWWPVPVIGPLPDTVIHCVLDQPEVWSWPAQAEAPVGWWVWTVNEDVIAGGPAWDTEGDYTIRIFDSMTGCADSTQVVVDVWPNLDVAAAPCKASSAGMKRPKSSANSAPWRAPTSRRSPTSW